MRIKDEIHHGDFIHTRVVDVDEGLDAFLEFLNSGPYGGGNVATPANRFAREAYDRFVETGVSDFGWRRFTDVSLRKV